MDCFVVFSGVALAVSFNQKTFHYLKYVLRNYIRYTLPILVSIGIIYVVPLFGSGPLWHLFDQTMTQPCKDNVLSTLFFTSNFQNNIEEICNLPAVFVSMIFQLKLVAPIILIINSYFNPKIGTFFYLFLLILVSIGNLIYRFVYDYKIPYEYRSMKSFTEIKQSAMFYLFNPFSHLSPLIIGLLVGHFIRSNQRKRKIQLKSTTATKVEEIDQGLQQQQQEHRKTKIRVLVIGFVCFLSFLACIFFMENMNLMNPQIDIWRLSAMITIGRVMLVAFHSWIIYASIEGHITIVNRFLSSIAFRPMSHLSYGFFLTSIIVTCYRLFSIRQTIILNGQTMFRSIVSDAVMSFLLSYLIHILVQQPLRNLSHFEIIWQRIFPLPSIIVKSRNHLKNNTNKNSHMHHLSESCKASVAVEDHLYGTYFVRTLSAHFKIPGDKKQKQQEQ